MSNLASAGTGKKDGNSNTIGPLSCSSFFTAYEVLASIVIAIAQKTSIE